MKLWPSRTKTDLSAEQKEAERYVESETIRFDRNRAEHHNLVALSPTDIFKAYVILAEKGKRT